MPDLTIRRTNRTQSKQAPVIIITGASSGIGEATARLFGRQNYRVVLAARRLELLVSIAEDIKKAGGVALPVKTDVGQTTDIDSLVERTLSEYGQIDVLFNNAGFGHMNWLERLDVDADIRYQIHVNLLGVILLTKMVLPHMIDKGCGHIINLSSISGFIGTPTYSVYVASKFGIRGFTEALRREVSPLGIYVSGIYPGGVESEFKQHMGFDRKTKLSTPPWLLLKPEEIAQAVYRVTVNRHKTVVLPKILNLAILFNQFFPGWVDWIINHRFTIPERYHK